MSNKFNFYISNSPVWWNRGVEIKPSKSLFDLIQWTKLDNNNFSISWINETLINVVVPNEHLDKMIKIEEIGGITKYYYRIEELDRTVINSTCIFELDIWTTYIMNGQLGDITSIRNLHLNTISPFVNIQPIGTPSGRLTKKRVPINMNNTIFKSETQEYGKCFTLKKYDFNGVSSDKIRPEDNNIYFVFTDKNTEESYLVNRNKEQTNYILIPVMNCDNLGLFTTLPGMKWDVQHAEEKFKKYSWIIPSWICNNYETLIKVVENKTNPHLGLGEFLGVWVGPSVLRFNKLNQNQKSQLIFNGGAPTHHKIEVFDNKYLTLTHDFTIKSEIEKWGLNYSTKILEKYSEYINYLKLNFQEYRGTQWEKVSPDNAFLHEWNYNNGVLTTSKIATLIAFRVSSARIKLSPLNVNRKDFVKNINYLGNPNNFLTTGETDLYFNQKFTFTNGKDSTDIDYQVPTSYDNYQNLLTAQRNTMNTGLWISGANSLFSLASTITGGVSKGLLGYSDYLNSSVNLQYNSIDRINSVSGLQKQSEVNRFTSLHKLLTNIATNRGISAGIESLNSLGKEGLQFFSTLAKQEAYKKDLRTTISNTITNMTDNYILFFKMIEESLPQDISDQVRSAANIDIYFNNIGTDLLYGYELLEEQFTKFYGYEDIISVFTPTFYQNEDCYILSPEEYIINKQLSLSNKYSPTIKQGIISLLENGIRVVGLHTNLEIPGVNQLLENIKVKQKKSK